MWKKLQSIREWIRKSFLAVQIVSVLLAITLIGVLLWTVPKWQVAGQLELKPKERIELEDKLRTTLAQIFGGLFFFVAAYLAWKRINVTQEGQLTERFTRAIEQLGNQENLAVRLGGIYALERIARDSPKDHWTIMEVLTAYVREKAPRKEPRPPEEEYTVTKPNADIQAILAVIGRRKLTFGKGEEDRLELRMTDLQGADLPGADLRVADLSRADLRGAQLIGANLSGADLIMANLSGACLDGVNLSIADLKGANLREASFLYADLYRAHLKGADLYRAHLTGSNLSEADLIEADLRVADLSEAFLSGANLREANLRSVNLRGAKLDPDILCRAKTLVKARLDPEVEAAVKQKCPEKLEK